MGGGSAARERPAAEGGGREPSRKWLRRSGRRGGAWAGAGRPPLAAAGTAAAGPLGLTWPRGVLGRVWGARGTRGLEGGPRPGGGHETLGEVPVLPLSPFGTGESRSRPPVAGRDVGRR